MIKIAIMGYGTVGSGVAEVLQKNLKQHRPQGRQAHRNQKILDLREFPDGPFVKPVHQRLYGDRERSGDCHYGGDHGRAEPRL